ncbi:MAG: glycosyltransferase family 4 protein [Verrucomicrobiota bacterium]|nr:glycosyltransferase family 4 protein [Verrucomicrobiota bacterium]
MPHPGNPWTILHTEASDGWGGQEIRIFTESSWMREQGHRVLIAAPRHSSIYQRAEAAQFEVRHFSFTQQSKIFDTFRLLAFLRQAKPQIIGTHSSTDSWAGLVAGKIAGVRTVRYRHISTPVAPNFFNKLLYRKFSDHVITTGECIRQPLIHDLGLRPEKVTVVATGIKPPLSLPERNSARLALSTKLNLPPHSRFIGCVAVLRSWKGQNILMEAFDQIASRYPDLHLVFVGEGLGREWLTGVREKLASKSRIHLIGHQSDPWPWFCAFEIALLVSTRFEGIPQSLLQAMFAKTAVIGSDIGGIPEIVLNGQTGLIVPGGNSARLAEALVRVLSNPLLANEMVDRAYQMVHSRHTLERMGHSVSNIFKRLLS